MQIKTPDYMLKVNNKLADCNINFVSGSISHLEKRVNIMEIIKM